MMMIIFFILVAELEVLLGETQSRIEGLMADLNTLRQTQDGISSLQNETILFLLTCIEDAKQRIVRSGT